MDIDRLEQRRRVAYRARRHPGLRHGIARLWLLSRSADARVGHWVDRGPVFPDGASPGSREWVGCAVLDDDLETVTVYYTAAGVRGEASSEYRQRLMAATGLLRRDGDAIALDPWGEHREITSADGRWYEPADEDEGAPHPDLSAPRGLYGFFSKSLGGPYEPLNESGLVLRNPDEEPMQAYSWLVLDDLSVISFVDQFDLGGRALEDLEGEGADAVRHHFGARSHPCCT